MDRRTCQPLTAKTIEAKYVAHETKASKMEQPDKKATDVPTESEEDEITAVSCP